MGKREHSEPLRLEPRYAVLKMRDLERACGPEHMRHLAVICAATDAYRIQRGKYPLKAMVVEHDWPEYGETVAKVMLRAERERYVAFHGEPPDLVKQLERERTDAGPLAAIDAQVDRLDGPEHEKAVLRSMVRQTVRDALTMAKHDGDLEINNTGGVAHVRLVPGRLPPGKFNFYAVAKEE